MVTAQACHIFREQQIVYPFSYTRKHLFDPQPHRFISSVSRQHSALYRFFVFALRII